MQFPLHCNTRVNDMSEVEWIDFMKSTTHFDTIISIEKELVHMNVLHCNSDTIQT